MGTSHSTKHQPEQQKGREHAKANLLKQRSRKSRHSGEMFSGMGGGPLLLAMWKRADTCIQAQPLIYSGVIVRKWATCTSKETVQMQVYL